MKLKFLALLFIVLLTACTRIEPGYVGIKVNLSGDNKGVDYVPLNTGWAFAGPNTSIYEYPTFVQTAKWTHDPNEGSPNNEEITFTTKDSMIVNADVSLSYALQKDKVPAFYEKFRNDDLNQFTHGFLRNVTRDQFNETAGKYTIEQIMGDNEQFLSEVRKRVQAQVASIGVQVEQFGLIGAPRPPAAVLEAINSKIQATQIAIQKQNEVAQAEADAKKRVAQANGQAEAQISIAKGEAESNRIRQQSITATMLEWKQLENETLKLQKWNGQLPSTVLGGNATPMIQVK